MSTKELDTPVTGQNSRRPSTRSWSNTSSSIDSAHNSAVQILPSHLASSRIQHHHSDSRILQCIASSSYPSSEESSYLSSTASLNFGTLATRLGQYVTSHTGSRSPQELDVRVMDWAEDVEQYAPEFLARERVVWEKTPLVFPLSSRGYVMRYGTLRDDRSRRDWGSGKPAARWDEVGDRSIGLYYVREIEVVEESEEPACFGSELTWWQCSLLALAVLGLVACGSWVFLE